MGEELICFGVVSSFLWLLAQILFGFPLNCGLVSVIQTATTSSKPKLIQRPVLEVQ